MPTILQHLDKYVDKMKKKVNNKVNGSNDKSKSDKSKSNKSDFKKSDKNAYWDNNDKPKRKKSVGETILTLFFWLLGGVLIIGSIILMNANMIFLIRKAICSNSNKKCKINGETPEKANKFLDTLFPTNCCEYPYGEDDNCPCNDPYKWTMEELEQIEKAQGLSGGKEQYGGLEIKLNKNCGTSFPYDKFSYGEDKRKFGRGYVNWFVNSLAITQTDLNSHLTNFLKSDKLSNINEHVLILLLITIIPLLLTFTYIYTFGKLIWEQVRGLWKVIEEGDGLGRFITAILIILSCFLVIGCNWMVSISNVFSVFYKFLIYPLRKDRQEVKNIVREHIGLLTLLFALIFTIAVVAGLPSDRWAITAKITVIICFIAMLWHGKGEIWNMIKGIFEAIGSLFTIDMETCKRN